MGVAHSHPSGRRFLPPGCTALANVRGLARRRKIDYFESTGSAAKSSFSLHHGSGNPHVTEIGIDRQWHNYAVEWTSTTITAYLDGVPYYSTTEISAFPPGPMWHSFQLDWMGYAGSVDTVMEVDWLRFYDAP
ncbi:MAG: family 16 glycosylhydrolase [Propionibacteriaceae bacterium]|nr:family 16 glycosylhydrolase [Propionibacteriaceae bacterium]